MKTIFKKKLIAILVGASFVLSAVNAQAIVNLDNNTGKMTFATELSIDSSGTNIVNATATKALNLQCELGFGASNAERYLRFDLSNGATFISNPDKCEITGDIVYPTTRAQGGAGESYVIYSIPALTAEDTATVVLTLPAAAAAVTIYNANDVTVTYSQYVSATDALSKTNVLSSASTTYIDFSPAIACEVIGVSPLKIDVTAESKKFENGKNVSVIGHVKIDDSADNQYKLDGTTLVLADSVVTAGTKLVVTGDFSAAQDINGGQPAGTWTVGNNKVWLETTVAGGCDSASKEGILGDLSATSAEFTYNDTIFDDFLICMEVNGVNTIAEGDYTALYDITPASGYSDTDIELGKLSELEKNGSTAQKTFVLNDSDAYSCYVRITNPSGISGSVFITMYNDNGDSVTFDLNQVSTAGEAMTGGKMKAGASTPLIPIADFYEAAQAADSNFAVSGASKKLRFDAEAEFGSNATTGIVVNVLAMARDGNSFFMLP